MPHPCDLFDLGPDTEVERDGDAVAIPLAQVAEAGHGTRAPGAAEGARFLKPRDDASGCLRAPSRHLGAEQTVLLP